MGEDISSHKPGLGGACGGALARCPLDGAWIFEAMVNCNVPPQDRGLEWLMHKFTQSVDYSINLS
jgi:hypothetical protein